MSRNEPSWRRYLTFWRPAVDRDVDAEIRFHFDERLADLMARGRTITEARAEAEQEFGDRDLYRERMTEIDRRVQARRSRIEWLHTVRGDARLAWRGMQRMPALTGMIVITLALGIGANGAIFSMLDRIFLRPPPGVSAPEALRRVAGDYTPPPPSPGFVRHVLGAEESAILRRELGSTYDLAGYRVVRTRLSVETEQSEMADVADVHGDYFKLLGVRPWRGRFFLRDELASGGPQSVAVLAHRFWRQKYASDTSIIGNRITVGRQKLTVVGIAPPGFDGLDLDAVDVWTVANPADPGYGPGTASIRMLVRLETPDDVNRFAQRANVALAEGKADFSKRTVFRSEPLTVSRFGTNEHSSAIAKRLAGVTLIVLLIAIANVVNLLLTRAMQRQREIAIRVSLGVSRARLAGQLFTESALLAIISGGVALLIATWGALLIRRLLFPDVRWADGPFDVRLALFTLAVALGAGLIAGVVPFVRTGRFDLAHAMRGGAREGAHRSRTRVAMLIAQAALSMVLLAGAAAFLRSLREVQRVDIGYDPSGVIMASLFSGARIIPFAERAATLAAARDRVASLPGVKSAALSTLEPMGGLGFTELHIAGRDSVPRTEGGEPTFTAVSPDFFRAMGVSLVRGRTFTAADAAGAPKVMAVTNTMARIVWGGATNAIGGCVKVGPITEPCTTVVGVIEDVHRDDVVEKETLQFFLPITQAPPFARLASTLIVQAEPAAVEALRGQIRSVLLAAAPGARTEIATFSEKLDPHYRPWRVGASLFTAFGILALLVAVIGIYSAISYTVTQRSHEIGVRMALGAQRSRIGASVVRSGVGVVSIGVAVGVVVAIGLGRLVDSQLYGTSSRDPLVLGLVGAALLAVAALAAALPAWRATRLDPVRALRAE